jgi:hypothetical protein
LERKKEIGEREGKTSQRDSERLGKEQKQVVKKTINLKERLLIQRKTILDNSNWE